MASRKVAGLALEPASAPRDEIAEALGFEHYRLASVGEDFRQQPLLGLVRDVGDRGAVGQRLCAAFELPARHAGRVEQARDAGVPEIRRVEPVSRLEPLVRESRGPHSVQTERACGINGSIPRVDAPDR